MNRLQKSDGFNNQKIIVLPDDIISDCANNVLTKDSFISDIGFFPNANLHYIKRCADLNSYIVMYCANGEGFYSVNNSKKETLTKGNLLIIPKNTAHFYGSGEHNPWSIYWFHAKGKAVDLYLSECLRTVIPLSFDMSSKFIALFSEIYDTLEKGYTHNNLVYTSKILDHLLGVIYYSSNYPQSLNMAKSNSAIEKSIKYMNENIYSNITLAELCEEVKFSAPYFLKLFKKSTGYSPIDYFLRLKIQYSCKYLDLTDYTVAEISEKLNFSDQYYFSRLFKKIMNKSPREYRKTLKG